MCRFPEHFLKKVLSSLILLSEFWPSQPPQTLTSVTLTQQDDCTVLCWGTSLKPPSWNTSKQKYWVIIGLTITFGEWQSYPDYCIHLEIFIILALSSFIIAYCNRTNLVPVTPSWTAAKVLPRIFRFSFCSLKVQKPLDKGHSQAKATGFKLWGCHCSLRKKPPWSFWGSRPSQMLKSGRDRWCPGTTEYWFCFNHIHPSPLPLHEYTDLLVW